jgi:hypothetical protein
MDLERLGDSGGSGGSGVIAGGSEEVAAGLMLRRVHQLELVWWSRNTGANQELSAWAPVCPPGTAPLGTVVVGRGRLTL